MRRLCANPLAHAIVPGDSKMEFLKVLLELLEMWCQSRSGAD